MQPQPPKLLAGRGVESLVVQRHLHQHAVFAHQALGLSVQLLTQARVTPVPSVISFGNRGLAINLLANPLTPVTIKLTKRPSLTSRSSRCPSRAILPSARCRHRPVASGSASSARATYSGTACRSGVTVNLRVFTNANGANPITDSLQWLVNPFAAGMPNATVNTTTADAVVDRTVEVPRLAVRVDEAGLTVARAR